MARCGEILGKLLDSLPGEASRFVAAERGGRLELELFIAGSWRRGRSFFRDRCPVSGEPLASVASSGPGELTEALTALRGLGGPGRWEAELLADLGDYLDEYSEAFSGLVALDTGKTLREARNEVARASSLALMAASLAEVQGVGPGGPPLVAMLSASSPLYTAVHALALALLWGRPVVLKPPSRAPLPALAVASLASGLGVQSLAVLTGSGAVLGSAAGRLGAEPLVYGDPGRCAGAGGFCLGRTVALVDPGEAGRRWEEAFAALRLLHSGQACGSLAWIVTVGRHDSMAAGIAEFMGSARLGDPLEPGSDVGPLIEEGRVHYASRLVDDALSKGAMLVRGGIAVKGRFYEPTVLARTPKSAAILWRDAPVPVAALTSAGDWREAARLAMQMRATQAILIGAPSWAAEELRGAGLRVYPDPEPPAPPRPPRDCLMSDSIVEAALGRRGPWPEEAGEAEGEQY